MRAIIWSHGKDSEPWGAKSTMFAELARCRGAAMEAPDNTDTKEPDVRVGRLVRRMDELAGGPDGPPLLVGSSMGGYVSAAAAVQRPCAGLFLIAPAVYMPTFQGLSFACQDFSRLAAPAVILHGWNDEVVPADNVVRFAASLRATLVMLDAGHRFKQRHHELALAFGEFLDRHLGG